MLISVASYSGYGFDLEDNNVSRKADVVQGNTFTQSLNKMIVLTSLSCFYLSDIVLRDKWFLVNNHSRVPSI